MSEESFERLAKQRGGNEARLRRREERMAAIAVALLGAAAVLVWFWFIP